jgi:hypothetical protein
MFGAARLRVDCYSCVEASGGIACCLSLVLPLTSRDDAHCAPVEGSIDELAMLNSRSAARRRTTRSLPRVRARCNFPIANGPDPMAIVLYFGARA